MPVDHIRYDLLVREALRGVVRRVVGDVAKSGLLPGEHHFYIAFDTGAPGVRISSRLRAQYPEEMTIVLQHQFWDLTVSDVGIEVGLSFGGIPEKLYVPFDAIKGFFDPSVQFGLEFEVAGEKNLEKSDEQTAISVPPASLPLPESSHEGSPRLTSRRSIGERPSQQSNDSLAPTPVDKSAVSMEPSKSEEPADGTPDNPNPEGGAQVVSLDRFRKK